MFIGGEFDDGDITQEENLRRSRRRERRRNNQKKRVSYTDAARPKDDDGDAKISGVGVTPEEDLRLTR